ncbi:unnamed protein product [Chironomus riparius]|uniref:Uncharacterized protein n=1 Tax=Chironomus riparius TaxID=315576 RepID=A0A9N9RJJ2_9DIPT|nr:unnamed protein product [Chironomus riparius]
MHVLLRNSGKYRMSHRFYTMLFTCLEFTFLTELFIIDVKHLLLPYKRKTFCKRRRRGLKISDLMDIINNKPLIMPDNNKNNLTILYQTHYTIPKQVLNTIFN